MEKQFEVWCLELLDELSSQRPIANTLAMQTTLVMTVIGADRTGLVEAVAKVVAEHGGNWLESRMCRLGGEFAGIVRVAVPKRSSRRWRPRLANWRTHDRGARR